MEIMEIIGINKGLIKVIIQGQVFEIQGEVALEKGKYVFYAYENSIKNSNSPYQVNDDIKQNLIKKIIEYSKNKEIKIVFE